MAPIEHEVVDERQAPHIRSSLRDVAHVAELASRLRGRHVVRHAASDERVDSFVEMRLQLVSQVAPHPAAAEELAEPAHDSPRARTR